MLVVDAKSPHKTVAELTAAMKLKGDKATYGTAAPNGRILGQLYMAKAGFHAVEVLYKSGSESLNELSSGRLDFGALDPVLALAQHRAGRLRILAVSTGQRLEASPELPTMTEAGVPMDLTGWWAAMVPAGTPKPAVDAIHKWFVDIVSTSETKAFLNKFGGDPYINTPEKAQEMFETAIKEWGEYVRIAKIEPMG
jgi:tripartite-type tricarboxylate transporter receptor subunit TctC